MLVHATTTKRRKTGGYSLLEILIVLGIIALLAAVVGPRLLGYFDKAKSQTTGLEMDNVKSAVGLFFVDTGRYPSNEEGLSALFEAPAGSSGWDGPYLESRDALTDAWARPYLYRTPADDYAFEIKSLGRDGAEGGEGEDADLVARSL